jgi:L,D-peptidoglycan transpeptidase YkuD (ErfK/YbiS/YcfS/YnhG family)
MPETARATAEEITVRQIGPARGELRCGDLSAPCALGPAGIVEDKREGDGGTPKGEFPLRSVFYRPDRLPPPETLLPVSPIDPTDGWCDDPASPDYNRPVRLPFPASHELMWREDHLYDLVLVPGHNDDPPVPGMGSAIFVHLARPGFPPTHGCVALEPEAMRELLRRIGPGTRLVIA